MEKIFNLIPVSEADTVWLLKQTDLGPVEFAFGRGGMALDEIASPEAAARLRAHWAEAFV